MICGGCNFASPGGVDSGTAWRRSGFGRRNGGCESKLIFIVECAWWECCGCKESNKTYGYRD